MDSRFLHRMGRDFLPQANASSPVGYPKLFAFASASSGLRVEDVPRPSLHPGAARPRPPHPPRPDRRPDRRQPRHRQHPAHPARHAPHFLKDLGARPFLVPAMGSHGGGTAEGQRQHPRKLRHHRGVRRRPHPGLDGGRLARAPRRRASRSSSTATPPRPTTSASSPASSRTPASTGPIESGLLKMMMIGLGKHVGALAYHRILLEQPFDQVVRSVGRTMPRPRPIAFGLALVENAYDETALVEAVAPADFERREEELLVAGASAGWPRLPFARGRPAHHRRDRQGHQRLGHGHQRRRPQAGLPARRRRTDQPDMRLIFVRGLTRADARQRHRHRPGRLHHHAAGPGHELPGHGHQLPDGRLSRRRQPAGPLRHATAK